MTAQEAEPTIRWWGPAPWGPICEDVPRVDIPVGQLCLDCRVKIEQYDRGLSVPFFRTRSGQYPPADDGDWLVTMEPHHQECFLRSVGADVTREVLDRRELTRERALELREQMWGVDEIAHEYDLRPDEVREILQNGTT